MRFVRLSLRSILLTCLTATVGSMVPAFQAAQAHPLADLVANGAPTKPDQGPSASPFMPQDKTPLQPPAQSMPPALPFTPDDKNGPPLADQQDEPGQNGPGKPGQDQNQSDKGLNDDNDQGKKKNDQQQSAPVERLEDRSSTLALAGKPADELLTQLKRERQPEAAKAIAAAIMADWSDSGSPTVNLLMQWADKAIKDKKNAAAFDFLDQAVVLKPDYANGWGRRASLHYEMGNYRKAMSDLNHVLALEPRHFGALEMLGNILGETGSDAKALETWQRYLDIYPADRAAQKTVTDLSEKLAGART
ncbi:hypothetical protein BJF91_21525 [Allorhizobium taibaishanense]|uniref:Uncharacterized protein n=1 Tax=Allorhizobium taibaishanense TaxID=887144 RepID=A0A1Q9A4X7_9HYPH|nr:hypothetical protein BJF91_21525 [Allorhizobium taibaishanense]